MSKIVDFFNLIGLEFKRVFRNKLVLIFLLILPMIASFVISQFFSGSNTSASSLKIAVVGTKETASTQIEQILDFEKSNYVYVETFSEGEKLLKDGDVFFLMDINTDVEPVKATIYYNPNISTSYSLALKVENLGKNYQLEEINKFFDEWGLTINDDYFDLINVKPIKKMNSIGYNGIYISQYIIFLSLFLMMGMTFSISRENETKVSKQLFYTPMSTFKYMSSKIITFMLFGVFINLSLSIVGQFCYKTPMFENFLIHSLTSLIYLFSICSLGALISQQKSQVSAALCNFVVVVLPAIVLLSQFFNSLNIGFQIFLGLFPPTLISIIFNSLIYYGIVKWEFLLALLIQGIIYYILAITMLKFKRKLKNS